MDFEDNFKKIFSILSDNVSNSVENIINSVCDSVNNLNSGINNLKDSFVETVSLSYYPKTEMIVKKEIDNNYNENNRKIDILYSKYIPNSLSEQFKLMQEQDKVKIYNTISDNLKKIGEDDIFYLNTKKLSMNYSVRAAKINPNDVKVAYRQFDLLDKLETTDKGAKIAELCLKLSNNVDSEKKFVNIYFYLGNHYLKIKNYKKALESYKNLLNYSNSITYESENSKLNIAKIYLCLGKYKKGLAIVNEIKDYDEKYPPELYLK